MKKRNILSLIDGLDCDSMAQSMERIGNFHKLIKDSLRENHDYGVFRPGGKASLLKPGAEKILLLLDLATDYEILRAVEDFDRGFFSYTIRARLKKNGQVITEGLGQSNSKELAYQNNRDSYLGANTCLKMAKKRAQVDGVLTVASLSEVFSQDLEDFSPGPSLDYDSSLALVLDFGRYRGQSLMEVWELDKPYVYWLRDKARQDFIREAAGIIIERGQEDGQAEA